MVDIFKRWIVMNYECKENCKSGKKKKIYVKKEDDITYFYYELLWTKL